MDILKILSHKFLSKHCYREFVEKFNYTNEQCLHQSAITGLGMFVMVVSAFLKLPQLMKMSKSRSSQGISMSAIYTELFAFTAGASYAYANSYPFSAWGEALFLAMQQFAISALVLQHAGTKNKLLIFIGCYVIVVTIVAIDIIPLTILWLIKACNLPILLFGKFMQCRMNYRNGDTGQLSGATCALTVLVCGARLITSVALTADLLMILQFFLATLTNTIISLQVLYYRNSDRIEKLKKA